MEILCDVTRNQRELNFLCSLENLEQPVFERQLLFISAIASNRKRCTEICSSCQKSFPSLETVNSGYSVGQHNSEEMSDVEETLGQSYCPDCSRGATIRVRPPSYTSTQREQEEDEIFCTYCIHAPIPAAKTCLQCEASLCIDHLRVHIKSENHILIPPASSITKRICLHHKKVLRYFCCEDAICVDCYQVGEHKRHQTETLNEASDKKKKNLRILLTQLTARREETEKRGQSMQERWEREKEKVAREIARVTVLFRDIKRQMEDLERNLLTEIYRQEEQISKSVSDLIHQLEIQKDELSRQIHHIEELCDAVNPLTVLLDSMSQTNGASEHVAHAEMVQQTDEDIFPPIRESVHGLVSVTVHTRLKDIITQSTKMKGFYLEEVSDIKLDDRTSARDLKISADQKTASWFSVKPLKPRQSMRKKNKQMFECSQVLSTRIFSSGRHYWEVESGEDRGVRLGVTYPNIVKKGMKFHVGENEKSWCLRIWYKNYSAIYDRRAISLNRKVESNKVGVFLDYRAGQLSFYEVDSSIRHLHTFTTTFTEPLYAAFWVYNSWVKIIS
ncbi:tripartite motif-containing protein 14-like [Mantella aurantiaca]